MKANNGDLYIAIPDTNSSNNHCMTVLKSTDAGDTWNYYTAMIPSTKVITKIKMVQTGLDWIFLFYLTKTGEIWSFQLNPVKKHIKFGDNFRDLMK